MDSLNPEHQYDIAMIRRAKPIDIDALAGLVMRACLKFDLGDLLVSRERITHTAQSMISDPQSLVLVHDVQGIDGAIVIGSQDALFCERKLAAILFWYATTPRSGYLLLRHAMKWVNGRPAIKGVGMSMEFQTDERVGKLLQRAGIPRRGQTYARY